MTVRWTLWLLASLVLGLVCRHATAQDLVTERAIFEDPRGAMTFEQVRHVQFSKADKVISKGYTNAALWIRLTVDSPTDEPTLVLRVYPAILDEVTLFSPDRINAGLMSGADEGEPVRTRASLSLLDVQPGQHVYYLRIKTKGAMLVASSVVTVEQAHQEDITRGIVLGAVLACCLPLMITLLVLSVKRREPLHILFLLNFSVSVAVFFGWFGYLQEFADTDSGIGNTATLNFLGLVNIFTGTLFLRVLLGRFGLPRWGRHLFTVFFVLYIPVFFLFFALDRQVILSYSTMWGFAIGTFMLPVTVYVFYRKNSATWLVAPILLTAILLSLRTILILQGLVAPDESTVNLMAFRIFALAGFCATILLLLDREKRSLLQTSILNETVARRLADAEKNRREIQERFMTMLMHELKTPLAIIQLAATSLGRHMAPGSGDAVRVKNINHSVNDLNALIERCVQIGLTPNEEIRIFVIHVLPARIVHHPLLGTALQQSVVH